MHASGSETLLGLDSEPSRGGVLVGVVRRECLPAIHHPPPRPQDSLLSVPYPTNPNLILNQLLGDPRKALSL